MAVPHTQQWKREGRRPVRRNMQSTIVVVASMKMMPQESKKPKRSIALPKLLYLEAIRVDWHREVDRLSIADFKLCQASITELSRN